MAVQLVAMPAAAATLQLHQLFGDGMVLQRSTDAPVWGWARPGATVTVRGSWSDAARVTAVAGGDGRWLAALPTPEAGGPHTISVGDDSGGRLGVRDVLIGEVWLCCGQSNMVWTVDQADGTEAALIDAAAPEIAANIRIFTVPTAVAARPTSTFRTPPTGWRPATPEIVRASSAVAFHFARTLHRAEGIPVGIIVSAVGGTAIESWLPMEALAPLVPASAVDLVQSLDPDPSVRERRLRGWGDNWWERLDALPGSSPVAWRIATDAPVGGGWTTSPVPMSPMPAAVAAHDGIFELRRTIELPPDAAAEWVRQASTLHLGPLDDMDDAWINGEHVGSTHVDGAWGTPRRYTVPAGTLRAGTNVVAMRILDTAGPGGAFGTAEQYALRREDGKSIPLSGEWSLRIGPPMSTIPARTAAPTLDARSPTALHNAMIAPLMPFALGGVCWYQGESNWTRPAEYPALLDALVHVWRGGFGRAELPVLSVQVAPFNARGDVGQWALLREAQERVLSHAPSGIVITLDVGDPKDIHPGDKRTVGERLANLARSVALGRTVEARSPQMVAHQREDDAIHVRFADVGGELAVDGAFVEGVTVAGADRRFFVARAEVDGETLVVRSPLVPEPVAVRYGWAAAPVANLFGGHGLPVAPFRTDEWSMPDGGWPLPDDEGRTPWLMSDDVASAAGFVALFNGADLSGWANINCAPETFRATSNDLGQPVIFCSGAPICILRTERMYRNFVLEMEFRHLVPGGNAGLFVWSDGMTAPGQPFTRSVEVQILDGHEGDWYTSDGDIFPIHGARMIPENGRGGDRAFPTERRKRPAPLWNHYVVTCVDGEITLAVNGAVVTRGRDAMPREGYICLESEGSPIEFRNLRIHELPAGATLAPALVADAAEGFEPLYTGTDLRGWRTDAPEHWRVRDWVLSYDGGGADLWSEESFEDFELIVDWRLPREPRTVRRPVIDASGRERLDADGTPLTEEVADAGDSGIFLRGSTKAQVNIWSWPIGSGEIWGYRTDPTSTDEVRRATTPLVRADRPPGQWNRLRIRTVGDRVTVHLNGTLVIDNAQLPDLPAQGPIGLQHHGDPIDFANIMIRRLPRE